MKKFVYIICLLFILVNFNLHGQNDDKIKVSAPELALTSVPFDIEIEQSDPVSSDSLIIQINKSKIPAENITRRGSVISVKNISLDKPGQNLLEISSSLGTLSQKIRAIPGWLSILPPIVAIFLALLTRQMIVSLFTGIWAGVAFIHNYDFFSGFFITLDDYIVNSLADPDHASIVIFSLLFGGMVGIISKNGGMRGIVKVASRYANSRRKGLLSTSMLGTLIFFDDYANTLLVGNTMRPFTDKLKISREKLSYIVDSTAAPIANLAPISTWAVFKMSLLIEPYEIAGITESPYITFLKSIPYSFYGIFSLLLLYTLAIFQRDFGPMLTAEKRAIQEGKVLRDGAKPLIDESLLEDQDFGDKPTHWINAILPVFSVIITTIISLYVTGRNNLGDLEPTLRNIIGNSNSFSALMWAAAIGCLTGLLLTISRKILSLKDTIEAWLSGIKSMVLAVIILVLAWSLGKVTQDMHTAEYIISITKDIISPVILPLSIFILSALVSFSTGTSWGTMSIFVPLVVPLALSMTDSVNSPIYLASFAAILSGATLGDHCSPISDTTILSSMASGADHIDHVKTQIPYAIFAGLIAICFGFLPAGLQIYSPFTLLLGYGVILLVIIFYGKKWETIRKD